MTSRITLTHGCSLSNLPLFVAEGAGLFAAEGLEVEVPRFTTLSATADILESGLSELGTVAFTEPLIDAHRSNPPIIVGGSGLMGITIMAQPEITSVGQLEGLKAGTFRRDPLEVLLHDALAAHGLGFDDLEIVYLDDIDDALAAFESRRIDAITLAEPHASRIRRLGAVQLSDGTELWGEPFPDTVLVATVGFLEAKPDLVSAALRAMIRAEQMIAADPSGMLDYAQRHYPGYDRDDLEVGARRQPPCIDIRYLEQTVYDRWDSLRSLGLVPSDAQLPANVVSFDLLAAELERAGLEGPESPPKNNATRERTVMTKREVESHDHSHAPLLGRRDFLCHCCIGGAATAAMLAGINRPALAGELTVRATHGTGLCNMAIFLAHARKMTEQYGITLEFVNAPTSGDIAAIFGSGQVDLSSIPYSNFFTLVDKGAPVKIISGTGAEGCVIVAQPGIDSAEKLRGKSLATFQADTLEVLPYDWLKKHGIDWAKMDVKFLGSSPEIVQAFVNGAVDSISHIEPYATEAIRSVPGAHVLSDGTDIYGPYYTDCVIAVSERLINADREAVKNLVRVFMVAQHESEKDRMQACRDTVGTYYKTDFETLIDASTKQFLMIDQRRHQQFMIDRSQSMVELGYTRKPIDETAFDWSILEEVIAEEPELYRSLIVV